ncbi:MAG: hypothetical protein HYZ53_23945 [Planctomycetes bacterium]|nr:hypothetical protein [Planctomycetota bacterium]
MAFERPTFHEAWFRVAELRPRLPSAVQVRRQSFRRRLWYVLQDPATGRFFRLHEAAYEFLGRLNGRRTVEQAWRFALTQSGDDALTQGEAVQLLGQLRGANLLQADVPPDSQGILERHRVRARREVVSLLTNVLAVRIPLVDPDALLTRWAMAFGWIFGPVGCLLLGLSLATLGYVAITRAPELGDAASSLLAPRNLPLLYLSLAVLKLFHELGHALSCKSFSLREGVRGEIHAMGVMFLVFLPLPYVDVSSAWALRRSGHRALIGAAGVLVELAIAGIAAVVWANTGPEAAAHALAYNVMFAASVSTLLLNGNPLLRYDAYYVLSDLLEIPNLAAAAREHLHLLVRRHAWSVKGLQDRADTRAEKAWLVAYGLAAAVFRTLVCVGILLFVADKFFFVGAVLGAIALVGWVLAPVAKFVEYLAASPELRRVRGRAIGSTLAAAMLGVACLGLLPLPEACWVEGVVEARRRSEIHMAADGFVRECLPTDLEVTPKGPALVRAENPDLAARRTELASERDALRTRGRLARAEGNTALGQALAEQVAALDAKLERTSTELSSLTLLSPIAGTWLAPSLERRQGGWLPRGQLVGVVAGLEDLIVRAGADQQTAARIIEHAEVAQLELRPRGRPELAFPGRIERILPAGEKHAPTAALGFVAAGGPRATAGERPGKEGADRIFTILIALDPTTHESLLPGQRVHVRVRLPASPLLSQAWQAMRRLIQRRFKL